MDSLVRRWKEELARRSCTYKDVRKDSTNGRRKNIKSQTANQSGAKHAPEQTRQDRREKDEQCLEIKMSDLCANFPMSCQRNAAQPRTVTYRMSNELVT